jgi:uncharacterized membrane protein
MTVGLILLIITGLLIALGLGQRALDRLRLTDTQAYIFIALIIGLGFVPNIPIGMVQINLGGCVLPLILCFYLFAKADTGWERVRSILASLVTGAAVWAAMRYLPNEPDSMPIDPNWLYGIAAAVIAYLFGKSRRCAFIAGVVGVILAQIVSVIPVWQAGSTQTLILGGAGGYDTIVIAGFLGVLLAEIIGEITERVTRGSRIPQREYKDGDLVKREEQRK